MTDHSRRAAELRASADVLSAECKRLRERSRLLMNKSDELRAAHAARQSRPAAKPGHDAI